MQELTNITEVFNPLDSTWTVSTRGQYPYPLGTLETGAGCCCDCWGRTSL